MEEQEKQIFEKGTLKPGSRLHWLFKLFFFFFCFYRLQEVFKYKKLWISSPTMMFSCKMLNVRLTIFLVSFSHLSQIAMVISFHFQIENFALCACCVLDLCIRNEELIQKILWQKTVTANPYKSCLKLNTTLRTLLQKGFFCLFFFLSTYRFHSFVCVHAQAFDYTTCSVATINSRLNWKGALTCTSYYLPVCFHRHVT